MKISDLIGNELIEMLSIGAPSVRPAAYSTMDVGNTAELVPAEAELDDKTDQEKMIPPLQQKMELLKKAVDVDNHYDDEDDDGETEDQGDTKVLNLTLNVPKGHSSTKIDLTLNVPQDDDDELDQIKRIAGIPVASIFDAGDDEPLDS